MNQERQELRKGSFVNVAGYIVFGLALISLGAFLGWKGWTGAGWGYWLGAVVSVVVGLLAIVASGMGEASCPACGATHLAITEGEIEKCTSCEKYLQGDAKAIWLVEDGHVAEEPTFDISLDQESRWPEGCCVCGSEATRSIVVEFDNSHTGRNLALAAAGLAAGALVVRTGGGSSGRVEVPHCEEHDDGAKWSKDGHLLLRSYAFRSSFAELNSAKAA